MLPAGPAWEAASVRPGQERSTTIATPPSCGRRSTPPRGSTPSRRARSRPGRASPNSAALGTDPPWDGPSPAADVVDLLATACGPGLTAMPSGRFYGMVIGGAHPAALAADSGHGSAGRDPLRSAPSPPPTRPCPGRGRARGGSSRLRVGARSGSRSPAPRNAANFTAGRGRARRGARRAGWDVRRDGLTGAPRVRVLVGAERHESVDLALSYLGLGGARGRRRGRPGPGVSVAASRRRWPTGPLPRQSRPRGTGPCLAGPGLYLGGPGALPRRPRMARQAGTCTPGRLTRSARGRGRAPARRAAAARRRRVSLFAAASPTYRHLVRVRGRGRWATDAHKMLMFRNHCGSRSSRTRRAAGRDGHARRLPHPERGAATALTRCPSSRGAVARSPSGGAAGARPLGALPNSWTGSAATRRRLPTRCAHSTARCCTDVVFTVRGVRGRRADAQCRARARRRDRVDVRVGAGTTAPCSASP